MWSLRACVSMIYPGLDTGFLQTCREGNRSSSFLIYLSCFTSVRSSADCKNGKGGFVSGHVCIQVIED
jgi:hypothetical protein